MGDGWVAHEDRLDVRHHIFQIWLIGHVPALQVVDRDLVELPDVGLAPHHFLSQVGVDVGLRGSVGEVGGKNHLDGKLVLLTLQEALQNQQIVGSLVSLQLVALTYNLELRVGLHEVNDLAVYKVDVLPVTWLDVLKPLLNFWMETWLLLRRWSLMLIEK